MEEAHPTFRLALAACWLCTFISFFDMMGGWAGQKNSVPCCLQRTIQLAVGALLGS